MNRSPRWLYLPLATVPDSKVLTPDVVRAYCNSEIRQTLLKAGLILTLAFLTPILNINKVSTTDDKVGLKQILSPLGVIVAAGLVFQSQFTMMFDVMTSEPRVETVTLVEKVDRNSKKGKYLGVFSNGSDDYLTASEYNECPEGTEFYVIMCGDTCVEHFAVTEYNPDQEG